MLKCAIQSHDGGSILLIPREGGHLFRMYVDLGEVAADDRGAVRKTTIEQIIAKANAIIHPYTLDVRNVAWHSVYEVGHRLTDRFDDVLPEELGTRTPRVFITGDACHTHSAKAGQGMNVSMQDGFNIGWKLGHVLEGRSPESLLSTYSAERQVVAKNLIDFDKVWSTLMAKKPEEFENPSELEDFYVRTAEFPAGFMTEYSPSMVVAEATHQQLATGFPVGKRFKSAPVVRVCDTNPVQLGHQATADGRWRIYVFADQAAPGQQAGAPSPAAGLAAWLATAPDSPLAATPAGSDRDARLDVKVIYQQDHTGIDIGNVPAVFKPEVGPFKLPYLEKVYGTDPAADIFELRGIDRGGVIVVVRPDQYVANVLPLTATAELAAFFAPLLRAGRRRGGVTAWGGLLRKVCPGWRSEAGCLPGPVFRGGVDAKDAHLRGEELQFLQRQAERQILGVPLDVGHEHRGRKFIAHHVAFQPRHVYPVRGESSQRLVEG